MKTLAISYFKTHALKIIEEVANNNENIVITKHGKPLARVVPFSGDENKNTMGQLSHTLVFENDIISPLGDEDWEACQ